MSKQSTITKEFTINELAAIENNIIIFRSCPAIPFAAASEINLNVTPIKAGIASHNDQLELLKERHAIIEEYKDLDSDKYKKASADNVKDLHELFRTKHSIEAHVLPVATFADVDICGDKEVKQQDGSTAKYPYRDAYFFLLETGLIA
jgi:hypothetical protein